MKLSIDKCAVISFTYKNININFNYTLFHSTLVHESIINNLGIFIDSKLYFNFHIDKLRNSALSRLGFLKRNCSKFNNQHALKNIYVSLVRSQLEYATLIWPPVNNN